MVTFAFGEILILVFSRWFGGRSGIAGIPGPHPFSFPGLPAAESFSKVHYYYLILALFLVTFLVMYRLDRSRFGMTCRAIQQADLLVESVGVSIMKYKLIAFMTACFFAGVAGSFYAHYVRFVNPDAFGMSISIILIMYIVIGGKQSIIGPILGVAILRALSSAIAPIAEYEPIIYAGITIMLVILMPGGLVSLPQRILARRGRS